MQYTNVANHLKQLYNEQNYTVEDGDILQIPQFRHNGCRITVTYFPGLDNSICGVMAVQIRTNENVVFTPFYLKNDSKTKEIEFTPFFDKNEYQAIKEQIIQKDDYSTSLLFKDIADHVLATTRDTIERVDTQIWRIYHDERTITPNAANDNILPMTIKKVRIGESSKKRIYRMYPYEEASKIVNSLYKANKTIVFTSNPNVARNIYALLNTEHISLEQ